MKYRLTPAERSEEKATFRNMLASQSQSAGDSALLDAIMSLSSFIDNNNFLFVSH